MYETDYDSLRKEIQLKLDKLSSISPGISSNNGLWENMDHSIQTPNPSTKFPLVKINSYYDLISCISTISSWISNYGIKLLYRGQRNFYNGAQYPSLIRELYRLNPTHYENLYNDIASILPKFFRSQINLNLLRNQNSPLFEEMNKNLIAIEGILQHYSLNTRYMDLVDQLQTAIWFSFFKFDLFNRVINRNNSNGYIFCYGVQDKNVVGPGIREGYTHRIISLREVVSSLGMRPHIQQAYTLIDSRVLNQDSLLRADFQKVFDYSKFVVCAVEIPNSLLVELLSEKSDDNLLAAKYLFPPDNQDKMLDLLKQNSEESSRDFIELIQSAINEYPHQFTVEELVGYIS